MTELERVIRLMESEIRLFPDRAPGTGKICLEEEVFEEVRAEGPGKVIAQSTMNPTIVPFIPENGAKAAVVVIPGGGFRREVMNFEGCDVAQWLNSLGIAAFVLKHRFPINDFADRENVTLIDAQRAIRVIRHNADKWGISPDKVGVMGFSAGGHLASLVSTCFDKEVYEPADEADRLSARPDFCVMGYPATCLEMEEYAATIKGEGEGVPEYRVRILGKYSTDKLVTDKVPPVFVFEMDDDKTTPVEHSLRFYMACRKVGVPAELHVFREGGHGIGLANGMAAGQWKELFVAWLHGLHLI